ncbi:Tim10/DDP family zinc finger protein [Aspergillus ruber CBS 135680]|uniref:Mitochondrial import inner membrane translocase subunit n=1 Tax=Aspergillus ruber (strain CBS 135680) TaxID=1388766 RepID=A0A017SRE2_ASPRC|nr:putative mitochondrial intermembrane space translocase subunit Tim10 [Aspergillus ruber CBS 135680]EYE99523.1 putative mitochondrial intermembrane space translocase subunit Tim10 [Aspergillus ruber CBS 135680]
MDPTAQLDLSKLSDADKKELNQFLTNEAQKSNIQQTVHHLADVCWKKCITGKVSSGRLDRAEEACAQNCVERWMDTNLSVLKHLEALRGQ